MSSRSTTDIDRTVGLRITALRKAKRMSQTTLGEAVGVTFQQVQKYEKGQNRVGAGRLHEIARLLDVPVSTLFGDDSDKAQGEAFDLLAKPDAVELLRAYAAIKDPELRRNMLAVVLSAARLVADPVRGSA